MNLFKKISIVLMLAGKLLAQPEFQNWHFGINAGLNFGTNPPNIITNTLGIGAGCASMSDQNGNLLFYTDGGFVMTSTHTIMANGSGLTGGSGAAQSAIAIKQPGSANIYYIFTTPGPALAYSIVDMSLASGAGSVTVKNATLFTSSTQRQVAIKHCNGVDAWIAAREHNSNNFKAYLLTAIGVNTVAVISAVGPTLSGTTNNSMIGALKCSPDGRKLAMTTYSSSVPTSTNHGFYLFDFDPSTGIVSNPITLKAPCIGAYGIEFSPDGSKLFGIKGGYSSVVATELYQWDICSGNPATIIASEYSLSLGTFTSGGPGMIQKAIDNKLYLTVGGSSSLHVINSPNNTGVAMNFVPNSLSLGTGVGRLGLPNFINKGRIAPTNFVQNIACQSGTFSVPAYTALSVCSYTSNPYTAYKWDFGDNTSAQNTATTATANHFYTALGTYTVKLIMYANCTNDTITQVVNVGATSPTVNVAGTFTVCKGDNRIYTASGGSSYQWSGSAVTNASISLSPTATTAYTVSAVQGSCSTSQAFTLTVNKCTGVSEQEDSLQVNLFPNPAKEHISLQVQSTANLRVLALDGKLVKQQALQTGTSDVDVTQLPAGMYIFEISDGTQMYRERVVIGN
jgi:PKD repeat protein